MTTGVIRTGNSTGIGVGTTKTEISPTAGLFMPSDAKVLLAVKTAMGLITPTADQTASARLDVESSDIRNMTPYEVLFAPIGSGDAAGSSAGTQYRFNGQEVYKINASLTGGEALHAYATALVTNTVAPECQAFFIVSNDIRSLNAPQLHAKLGTLTASGNTADTDVPGTKYSFSGGRAIVELFGMFHPLAAAAGDMVIGEIKYSSSEYVDSMPVTLPLIPASIGLGTTVGWLLSGVSRQEVYVPVKPGQVNVQDYFNFGGALGVQGNFIDGVIYV